MNFGTFCHYFVNIWSFVPLTFSFFGNLYLLFWCFPLKTWLFSRLSSPSCKFCIWLWPFRAWYTHERVILSHFLPFLLNFVIILQCANLVLSFYAFFPYNFVIFTSYLCFAFVLFSLFIKLFIFQVNFGLFWPYFVILTLNLGFSCDIYPIFWGFSSEHLDFFRLLLRHLVICYLHFDLSYVIYLWPCISIWLLAFPTLFSYYCSIL